MLCLAIHTVDQVSAKIGYCIILLQDLISSKKVPADLKCRMLLPASGTHSASLWDAPSIEELQAWLNEHISVDCKHAVYEAQEEFALGIGEVFRARAAEKVAAGTKDVADRTAKAMGQAATAVNTQVHEIDTKLKISERVKDAATAVSDSAVGRGTAAALTKVGSSVRSTTNKVMESETMTSATEAMGAGFKKLGQSFSSLTGRMRRNGSDPDELSDGLSRSTTPESGAAPEAYAPPPPQAVPAEPRAAAAAPAFTLDGDHP